MVLLFAAYEKVDADISGTKYQTDAKTYLTKAQSAIRQSKNVQQANKSFASLDMPRFNSTISGQTYSVSYKKALHDRAIVGLIRGSVSADLAEHTHLAEFKDRLEQQVAQLHVIQQNNPQQIALTNGWIDQYKPMMSSLQSSLRTSQVPPAAQPIKAQLRACYQAINTALSSLDAAVSVGTVASYYTGIDQLDSAQQQLDVSVAQLELLNPSDILFTVEARITEAQKQL